MKKYLITGLLVLVPVGITFLGIQRTDSLDGSEFIIAARTVAASTVVWV
jgi:uncharacterized membrane protein